MSGWQRLMRLWELSAPVPTNKGSAAKKERLMTLPEMMDDARFIPRIKRDHIQELTQDA